MEKEERDAFFHDVNEFCRELRPIEEVCYIEHKFNDQLVSLEAITLLNCKFRQC